MAPRNLTLFFPDDRPATKHVPKALIEQINRTPYLWDRHCRDAAQNKQVTIDLLSADVNYTRDESDPGFDPTPGPTSEHESNAWGLVHALMGIARRRVDDGCGNFLPLAWEIRTVSPEAYRRNPDATRLYGLLRSLAADPEDGEVLEHAIHREFARDHPEPLNCIPADGELHDVFIEDLAQQPSRFTDPVDAVSRLLPQWRARFGRAIAAGRVKIDLDQAHKTLDVLKRRESLSAADENTPSIPIAIAGSKDWYGISLVSVMADVVDETTLDLALKTPLKALPFVEAPNAGPRPGTVMEWFQTAVVQSAGGLLGVWDPAQRLKEFANKVHDAVHAAKNGAPALSEFMKSSLDGKDYDRALLLIVLIAHTRLHGKKFSSLMQLSRDYRYKHHDNLFLRPIENYPSIFAPMTRAPEFAKELERALKNEEHKLDATWQWIRRGLSMWYEEKLKPKALGDKDDTIPLDIARKNAPGLFA